MSYPGVQEESKDSIRALIGTIVKRMDIVENIEMHGKRARITCKTAASAKNLYDQVNGRQVGEFKFHVSLFNSD